MIPLDIGAQYLHAQPPGRFEQQVRQQGQLDWFEPGQCVAEDRHLLGLTGPHVRLDVIHPNVTLEVFDARTDPVHVEVLPDAAE